MHKTLEAEATVVIAVQSMPDTLTMLGRVNFLRRVSV